MPNDPEVRISIECVHRDSDLLGILKVATNSGVSKYGIGSVGIPWPIGVISTRTDVIFVAPGDSEQAVALMMRRQQQFPQFLAAMMANGGMFETPIIEKGELNQDLEFSN